MASGSVVVGPTGVAHLIREGDWVRVRSYNPDSNQWSNEQIVDGTPDSPSGMQAAIFESGRGALVWKRTGASQFEQQIVSSVMISKDQWAEPIVLQEAPRDISDVVAASNDTQAITAWRVADRVWFSRLADNRMVWDPAEVLVEADQLHGLQLDDLAAAAFDAYCDVLNGRPNTKGGKYRVNLLPTTVHIYFGSVVGAMPNGRKAGETLSEGISPSQGADLNGPTAVLKSAARIDHTQTGGTLLNLKFSPQTLDGEGIDRLADLVRSYFNLDGHHVQFNVIDAAALRQAQQRPEEHRDLIVRVAGFSDYFVDVGRELQNEIISRTEHSSF